MRLTPGTVRRIVRVAATVVGLAAGTVLVPLSLAGMFTLRNDELPEGMVALATPLLLVPLVIGAAAWPRPGGQVLMPAAAVSAGAYLWSLVGALDTSIDQAAPLLGMYAAICALGLAFWWSGLRR